MIQKLQSYFPLKRLISATFIKQTPLIYTACSDFPHLFGLSKASCTGSKNRSFRRGRWAQPHMWLLTQYQYNTLKTAKPAIFFLPPLHCHHTKEKHRKKKTNRIKPLMFTYILHPHWTYRHRRISSLGNTQHSIVMGLSYLVYMHMLWARVLAWKLQWLLPNKITLWGCETHRSHSNIPCPSECPVQVLRYDCMERSTVHSQTKEGSKGSSTPWHFHTDGDHKMATRTAHWSSQGTESQWETSQI